MRKDNRFNKKALSGQSLGKFTRPTIVFGLVDDRGVEDNALRVEMKVPSLV